MLGLRKLVVYLLAVILLITLVATAYAASLDVTIDQPAKIENWLAQSNIYNGFAQTAIQQYYTSTGNGQTGSVALSDPVVEQAANAAFSPTVLQQAVHSFLNANYGWLQGTTKVPSFTIDLSSAKQQFAQAVGQAVTGRLSSLPACTASQLATMTTIDPLSISCRPPTVDPQTAGTDVTSQLVTSNSFLANPVITADNLSPNGNSSRPYYKQFSFAPRLYQLAMRLPLMLGALAIILILGIVFISPSRRKGLRKTAFVLLEAALLIGLGCLAANTVFRRLESRIFNSSNVGQLQKALTDFLHRVESQIVRVDLYFVIGFALVGIGLLVVLVITRNKDRATPAPGRLAPQAVAASTVTVDDGAGQTDAQTARATQSPRPKRPRLIQ